VAAIPTLLASPSLVLLMIGYLWLLEEAFGLRPAWGFGVLFAPLLAGPLLVFRNPRAGPPCVLFLLGFATTAFAVVAGFLVRAAGL